MQIKKRLLFVVLAVLLVILAGSVGYLILLGG